MYAFLGLKNEEDYLYEGSAEYEEDGVKKITKGGYEKHKQILKGTLFELFADTLFPENEFSLLESTSLQRRFMNLDKLRDAVYEHKETGARFNIDFKFKEHYNDFFIANAAKVAEYHNFRIERGGTPLIIVGKSGRPYLPDFIYIFPVPDLTVLTKDKIEFEGQYSEKRIKDEEVEELINLELEKYKLKVSQAPEYQKLNPRGPFIFSDGKLI